MRRLLLLPLAAAAFAAPPAHAVPCYGTAQAGVCAGVVCEDLCPPRVVVDPYCGFQPPTTVCDRVDRLYYSFGG